MKGVEGVGRGPGGAGSDQLLREQLRGHDHTRVQGALHREGHRAILCLPGPCFFELITPKHSCVRRLWGIRPRPPPPLTAHDQYCGARAALT